MNTSMIISLRRDKICKHYYTDWLIFLMQSTAAVAADAAPARKDAAK